MQVNVVVQPQKPSPVQKRRVCLRTRATFHRNSMPGGRQRQCLDRAHRAWFHVLDENLYSHQIAWNIDEHRPSARPHTVELDLYTGQFRCGCPRGCSERLWCEHACYVALYELDLGEEVVTEQEMFVTHSLAPSKCIVLAFWAQWQLGRAVLFQPSYWVDKDGTRAVPLEIRMGAGNTDTSMELMMWPERPRHLETLYPSTRLEGLAVPQFRIAIQARRHMGRAGTAMHQLVGGKLGYTFRETRRHPATVTVDLATGHASCDCYQAQMYPNVWCKHCCGAAMMLLRGRDEIDLTIGSRTLSPADAFRVYNTFSGQLQDHVVLLRGHNLHAGDCPVCTHEVKERAHMCSNCRVGYHEDCIREWLQTAPNPTCPTCRRVMD